MRAGDVHAPIDERHDPSVPLPGVVEAGRLAALEATGLMDSDAEVSFDRFTSLATLALGFPVALISLVDDRRQFFKSATNLPEPWASRREIPLSHSFCQHVVSSKAPLIVSDARQHPVLKYNEAVPHLGVAAYAGMPLTTDDGHTLGAFCVVSSEPHEWTAKELETLRQLAAAIMTEVELRRSVRRLAAEAAHAEQAREALRVSEDRYKTLVQHMPNTSVVMFDHELRCVIADGAELLALLDLSGEMLRGRVLTELMTPENVERLTETSRNALRGAEETIAVRRCDRYLDVHTRPVRDGDGNITGGMLMIYDVTAAKQAELALRAQTVVLKLVEEVATAANQSRTSKEAFGRVLTHVGSHMGWAIGHAYLREGDALVPSNIWYLENPEAMQAFVDETRTTRYERGTPGLASIMDLGKAIWRHDLDTGSARKRSAASVGLRTGLAFPVLVGDEVAAVLEFCHVDKLVPDEAFIALMVNIGTQLGRVVERERHDAEVKTLAIRDELTGLLNRRGFMDLGQRHHENATRSGNAFTLVFVDLNGLKPINDQLGHEAGDSALRDTGEVLRSVFRDGDLVARLGGDEFVVLAASAPAAHSERLEQRIRDALTAFNARGIRPYRLSLSIGTSTFEPAASQPLETLLAEADAEMYAQKRARRASSLTPVVFGRVG